MKHFNKLITIKNLNEYFKPSTANRTVNNCPHSDGKDFNMNVFCYMNSRLTKFEKKTKQQKKNQLLRHKQCLID